MARAYTIATIALALSVDLKWVDNVLSRFTVTGVEQSRQGVARRVSRAGVLPLAIVLVLTEALHVPIELAVERAHHLASSGELTLGGGLLIQFDRNQQLGELERRLEYAVETAPIPRRGRPPGKTKRGAD